MNDNRSPVEVTRSRRRRTEKEIAQLYISVAREKHVKPSNYDIEIDDEPRVSTSEEGAWVAAWVWVMREEVGLRNRRLSPLATKTKPAKSQG
jgi:hypothetical protein